MNCIRVVTMIASATLIIGCSNADSSAEVAEESADVAVAGTHMNDVVNLLEAKQPVFGLYAPANRRVRPDGPALPPDSAKTPGQLAAEAAAHPVDYIFDGSMEGDFDGNYPKFAEFATGMADAGFLDGDRLKAPMIVKMTEILPDTVVAKERIWKQLDLGVSGIMFVGVENAVELKTGIDAMRFASHGGTRPDAVGDAAARWGMTADQYKTKADVWPLNPDGELINFAVVESLTGLEKVREIAAVEGVGVLFPGAGTLRGIFSTTNAAGERVLDEAGWEAAIQQVLAACKEFNVPCGYPAGEADIEERMRQGFTVFVAGWGEPGFRANDLGMAASGRAK